MINILVTGVGGQGTILASSLIQEAYLRKGAYIKSTETIGMAQMGGSVNSHIRIGDKVHSPLIPQKGADLVLAFEPGEGARSFKYLSKDTLVLASTRPIRPITDTLAKGDYDPDEALAFLEGSTKLRTIDFGPLFEKLGTNKPLNVAMIGYSIGLDVLDIEEEIREILKEKMSQKILNMNLLALDYGIEKGSRDSGR